MSENNIVEVNESNFKEEVIDASTPVIVDFWAPWCGPCKMIAPVLEEIAAEKAGSVKIAKVNIDHNQALAHEHDIRAIPTLLIFKGGNPVDTIVGFGGKEALLAKIEAVSD